jgi:hypothetical protein
VYGFHIFDQMVNSQKNMQNAEIFFQKRGGAGETVAGSQLSLVEWKLP